MDAYLEFLNENSQRAYPLRENSQPVDTLSGTPLPQDLLLDLSGYSLLPVHSVRLFKYSGADSGVVGPYAPLEGSSTLFFRINTGGTSFDVGVPIVDMSYGARASGSLAMPGDVTVKAVALVVTIGAGTLPDDEEFDFGISAPLEPSLIFDMSGSQVNLLEVIRQDVADYVVHGDVKLRAGYNMDIAQIGQTITLSPARGAGELGLYDAVSGTSPCTGLVLSISGVRPNLRGEFVLKGGKGIVIEDFPDDHKIVITASPANPAQPGC